MLPPSLYPWESLGFWLGAIAHSGGGGGVREQKRSRIGVQIRVSGVFEGITQLC